MIEIKFRKQDLIPDSLLPSGGGWNSMHPRLHLCLCPRTVR